MRSAGTGGVQRATLDCIVRRPATNGHCGQQLGGAARNQEYRKPEDESPGSLNFVSSEPAAPLAPNR
jgi:hypothetical protein